MHRERGWCQPGRHRPNPAISGQEFPVGHIMGTPGLSDAERVTVLSNLQRLPTLG